jgi:hypothetical protein
MCEILILTHKNGTTADNVIVQILFLLFLTLSFYMYVMLSGDIKDVSRFQNCKLKMFRPIDGVTFHNFITAGLRM